MPFKWENSPADWDGEDTDPGVFPTPDVVELVADEPPTPLPKHLPEDETARRCSGCGARLSPDDASFRKGGIAVLEALRDWFVAQGIHPVTAARWVQDIARDSGVLLT